ncbi:DUF2726 domain-containing protein [Microcoleus vaginatus GB1-A2]|uniref:DUF2726 domain-containing protein n=1 Tax=Microcoleus vaginatus TaxID=119532 RepID=UPI001689A5B5|nr:DUF2726 domain-containing protein [Microcoleus sp. FACHB-61]
MSVIAKKLVNSYEARMLEFLHTCVDNNYKIHTQVGLSQMCEQVSNLDWELKKFLFSPSAVDALITDLNYNPCLVVEFQSQYHDSPEAKKRDRKKATLLELAKVPLIYSRVKDSGLLYLFSHDEEVVFNLFTGQNRENAQGLIRQYCRESVAPQFQLIAW